jgi:hypothetical protein
MGQVRTQLCLDSRSAGQQATSVVVVIYYHVVLVVYMLTPTWWHIRLWYRNWSRRHWCSAAIHLRQRLLEQMGLRRTGRLQATIVAHHLDDLNN